jgi:hypothetical protein
MRTTSIAFFVRPAMTVLALVISLHAHTADNTPINAQDSGPSLLDQLLSPPAPLRDSTSANFVNEITEQARHWLTISGSNAGNGKHWQLALDTFASTETPTPQLSGLQRFSSAFLDQALSQQTAPTGRISEQFALMQSINSAAASLMALPNIQHDGGMVLNANSGSDSNRQIGQWLANAAQYAGNLQISAVLPRDANFVSQAPAETVMTAINSPEVTQYLMQHSESVSLLAQLLGWQKTGLLPSATDLQKMAANQVGAVTSSIERWALHNVSFSASTLAITNSDTQEQNLQWQWSATNTNQYNSNRVADNEANLGVNLRRLFGMSDYY